MPGDFTEGRQVSELGLKVADVGLVQDDRNSVHKVWRIAGCVDRFADAALRRRDAIAVADTVEGHAAIKEIVVAVIELVLLDVGGIAAVEQARNPVEFAAGLGGQTDFFGPGFVIELVMAGHQHARVGAVQGRIERE